LVGLSVALAARIQARRLTHLTRGPYLVGVLLYSLLVLAPIATYLVMAQPAWFVLYLVNPHELGWALPGGALLATLALGPLGFLVGFWLCHRRMEPALWVLVVLTLGGIGAIFTLSGDRLSHLSDTMSYLQAPTVLSSRMAAVLAFLLPVMLGGWIFLLVFFAMEGRKIRLAAAPVPETQRLAVTSSYGSSLAGFEKAVSPDSKGNLSAPGLKPSSLAGVPVSQPGLSSAAGQLPPTAPPAGLVAGKQDNSGPKS
jgi:hypothetical protein